MQDANIADAYQTGSTIAVISKQTGLSQATICRRLKKLNITARKRKYALDETLFDKIDAEWKAYFLGLAFADGNVRRPEKGYSFKINLHERDKSILELLAIRIYGSTESLKYQKAVQYIGKDGKTRNNSGQWMLSIHNKKIIKKLIWLGCEPVKSLLLRFPNTWDIPKELFHHFIRGYFDGDGWAQRSDIGFISTKTFCLGLQEYLRCYADVASQLSLVNNFVARLRIQKQSERKKLLDYLYKDATIFLERKKEKF